MQVEKNPKELPRNPSVSFGKKAVPPCRHGWSVSHPHGWLPFMWNDGKDVRLTERCIFVIFAHMSCSSPCILFLCYIYLCVWWCNCWFICFSIGSGRYFLVSVRVSVVASCSFLCSQLSSYIVFLPAFQSTCLPVYLSTYLPTFLPIIDLSSIYLHSSFNRSLADLFICFYFVVCFSVCWFINPSFVSWFISQHLIYWI